MTNPYESPTHCEAGEADLDERYYLEELACDGDEDARQMLKFYYGAGDE